MATTTDGSATSNTLPQFVDSTGIYNAVMFLFGLATTGINCLTLYGLVKARSLKKTLRLCLINLAITDAAAGAVFSYHSLAVRLIWMRTLECDFRYGLLTLMVSVTFFTLVMMSLDRVIALYLPFRYEEIMTTRNVYVWIAFNWLASTGIMVHGLLKTSTSTLCNFIATSQPSRLLFVAVSSLVVTGLILAMQLLIFSAAIRQVRKIVPVISGAGGGRILLRGVRLHMKATVTTGIVTVPFFFLTVPLHCVFSYLTAHPEQSQGVASLANVCFFLQTLNSFVNPAIYIWRLSEVRGHLKTALSGRCVGVDRSSKGVRGTDRSRSAWALTERFVFDHHH